MKNKRSNVAREKKNVLGEKAAAYFEEGYNCAQSVLLATSEYWNVENELIPKIATAFGGGIGRCGSVCGAVAGGVMALGIKYGSNEPSMENRLKTYKMAQKFYKRFKKRHGAVLCRELIGFNLLNPKELEEAKKANVLNVKCPNFIKGAVKILQEISK